MCIYPTLCELVGVPVPKHVEGVSIKPLLANPASECTHPALSTMYRNNHTLVTSDWRYIRYEDGTEELYNERTDPHEWTNVAGKAEFASVKQNLAKYLPTTNAVPVPEEPAAPAKKKKAKRAQSAQ